MTDPIDRPVIAMPWYHQEIKMTTDEIVARYQRGILNPWQMKRALDEIPGLS